jgi:hypothetical protein
MAKKDIITINGVRTACLNTDRPVGSNLANDSCDVLLVQAMLKRLAELGVSREGFLGLPSRDAVPEPNGNFEDGKTLNAILSYQRRNARKLLRVDGVIHPAAYQGRNIEDHLGARFMTITLLHLHLVSLTQMALGPSPVTVDPATYITDLLRIAPALRRCIQ